VDFDDLVELYYEGLSVKRGTEVYRVTGFDAGKCNIFTGTSVVAFEHFVHDFKYTTDSDKGKNWKRFVKGGEND